MTTHIHHPHSRALMTIGVLVGFGILAVMAVGGLSFAGYVAPWVVWIGVVFCALFGLMLLGIWIDGLVRMRRANEFLQSERVLVRWTYSLAEWQQLKETVWLEEKDDWKVQFGCLAFLLALAGMLSGVMIGLEEGIPEAVAYGLVGLLAGGLIGGFVGVLVAGGNYLGARQAYRQAEPGQVALGVDEVFTSDNYFKGNGTSRYIRSAKLLRGPVTMLEFELVYPPRPRLPSVEQWTVAVPAKWVERVEAILPRLVKRPLGEEDQGLWGPRVK